MRHSYYLLLALMLTGCGINQRVIIHRSSPETTVIPLDLSAGFPHLTLSIAGQEFPVLLDLGGFSSIALSDSILQLVPHEIAGSRSVDDAYGNRYRAREYTLRNVRISSLDLLEVEGSETKHFVQPRSHAANGYVGWQFFNKFKHVILDYPSSQIVVSNSDSLPLQYRDRYWSRLPYRDEGGVVSDVSIDGKLGDAWWDTGASVSIVDPAFLAGGEKPTGHLKLRLEIGSVDFGQHIFYPLPLSGPGTNALIGHNFFLSHIVWIDLTAKQIGIGR